jgi:hypothetical protein
MAISQECNGGLAEETNLPAKKDNEAWLALASVWKDDPNLEELIKVIGKQRAINDQT